MSSPARIIPRTPKTTGTTPSRCHDGPGRIRPTTSSTVPKANVTRPAGGEYAGGEVDHAKRRDQAVHCSISSAPPLTAASPLEPLEGAGRLRAPRERRAAAVQAVVQGHQ